MENRQLFLEVVSDGTVAGTSRRLGLSRSTISRRLTLLEKDLGLQLFHRDGKSLRLTGVGRDYATAFAEHDGRLGAVVQRLRDRHGELRGMVRLTSPVSGTGFWLGSLIGSFRDQFPDVQLRVEVGRDLRAWAPSAFDVGIQFGLRMNPSLVYRKLYDETAILVASPSYVAKMGEPTTMANLLDHVSVAERDPTGRLVPWRLPDGGRVEVPPAALETNATDVALWAALAGTGLWRAPELLVRRYLERGELVRVLPDVYSKETVGLVHAPDPPRLVKTFVSFTLTGFRERWGVG